MPQRTYHAQGIVLKKTKLGESDLIITLLSEDGLQIRCVAKGARKPSSSFASRLELYSQVNLLLASGRNLDIVKECKLAHASDYLRDSLELNTAASAYAELLTRLTEQGSENAKLFQMSQAFFATLSDCNTAQALTLSCAACVKAFAFSGIGAYYVSCVLCGTGLPNTATQASFSTEDGGFVCEACRSFTESEYVDASDLRHLEYLLRTPFDHMKSNALDAGAALRCFELIQQWSRYHLGCSLKSINFLGSCGLF